MNLTQISQAHKGKLAGKWGSYLIVYDRILGPYRELPINLLEIGVQNGGMLEIWSEYFSNANSIVGCDIEPVCAQLNFDDPRIRVVIGDATDQTTANEIFSGGNSFDIIIDDGSHQSCDIIRAFSLYFATLRAGGIYIAEDLHCSYWQDYGGGLHHPKSSLSFFKQLVDMPCHDVWGLQMHRKELLQTFAEDYGCSFDEEALGGIHSVSFHNSLCCVTKSPRQEIGLGTRTIVGQQELIATGHAGLNGQAIETSDESQNSWSQTSKSPVGLINSIAKFTSTNNELTAENDDLQAKNNGLQAENDGLQAENDGLQKEIRSAQVCQIALQGELATARHELTGILRQSQSSRWLAAQLLAKLLKAPFDIERRIQQSSHKRVTGFDPLKNKEYRKYTIVKAALLFQRFIPRPYVDRLNRRKRKSAASYMVLSSKQASSHLVVVPKLSIYPDLSYLRNLEPTADLVIVLHLFFDDLWDEIKNYLINIEQPYDLIVSLAVGQSDHLGREILNFKHDAITLDFPNLGRDIGPFMALLNSDVLSKYQFLLKIHSKKTLQDPQLGIKQRRVILDALLGSPEQINCLIVSMRQDPKLGLVAPDGALLHGRMALASLDANRLGLDALEHKVGIPVNHRSLEFAAGSMFWARPSALAPLVGKVQLADFEPEPIPNDGALPHALERYFGTVVAHGGYDIRPVSKLIYGSPYRHASSLKAKLAGDTRFKQSRCSPCQSGVKTVVHASFSPTIDLKPYVVDACRKLKREGFHVIMVVATDHINLSIEDPGIDVCDTFIVRENSGFDFASWALGLRAQLDIWSSSSVTFLNDSVYGPFDSFFNMWRRIDESAADFIALTESNENRRHYQSYFFVMKNASSLYRVGNCD